MDWIAHNWIAIAFAGGLIATWTTMTLKMSQWDKIIPNLATKVDVEASVKTSILQLKNDLQSAEIERLRRGAGRIGDEK
jgi:hypothetical protein